MAEINFEATKNIQRAETSVKTKLLTHEIESGSLFINGMVKSDPKHSFVGMKLSAFSKKLSNYEIKEFVNIKIVWVK